MEKHIEQNRSWYALEDLALGKNSEIDKTYRAITISRYGLHLRNWLRHFPRKQIFIASSEMIVQSPVKVVKKLERFLNVPTEINDDYFVMNRTRGFFCFRELNQDPRTAQLTTIQDRPETRNGMQDYKKIIEKHFKDNSKIIFKNS